MLRARTGPSVSDMNHSDRTNSDHQRPSGTRRDKRMRLVGVGISGALLLSACGAGASPPSLSGPGATNPGSPTGQASAVPGSQTAVDSCSHLTTAEIETATGHTVVGSGPAPNWQGRCEWTLSGEGDEIVQFQLGVELDSPLATDDHEFNCTVGFGLEPITGVGDSACGQVIEGGSYMLHALHGDDSVTVDVTPDATRLIDHSAWATLAEAVFAKLP